MSRSRPRQSFGRGPDAADYDIWRLLEQLPESQQVVIRMLKVSGMSLQEVANATGSTVGAVKQKAHRAYEKLRVLLQDTGTAMIGICQGWTQSSESSRQRGRCLQQ